MLHVFSTRSRKSREKLRVGETLIFSTTGRFPGESKEIKHDANQTTKGHEFQEVEKTELYAALSDFRIRKEC